jgi:putative ABC transport system permease protein
MFQDLRYGFRMLGKKPGFTAVAILTFALGVGANTVIFSGVYALLLGKLPYPNADRLVVVNQSTKQGDEKGVAYQEFVDWRAQSTALEQAAAFRMRNLNFTVGDKAERVAGAYVSQMFLLQLGGRALLGRVFSPEEHQPGAGKVVVLSHTFWERRFGADPAAIGKTVKLDDQDFTIIGVLPQAFQAAFRNAFWVPLEANEPSGVLTDASDTSYQIIATLRPGSTIAQVAGELENFARRSTARRATNPESLSIRVVSLSEASPGAEKLRAPLLTLQFGVLFVLLIAAVNLANLLLAQNTERRQEFTIRLALGAGPGRLIRQLLLESLLLGALGSALGLIFAYWGLSAIRSDIPARIAAMAPVEINGPVLLLTLGVSLLTSLAFGLGPAILASRQEILGSLKSNAAGVSADLGRRRLSRALMTGEVALAAALLIVSGLMIRSFLNLTREDPGFNPDHALAITISLPSAGSEVGADLAGYFDEAISRIKAEPGVTAVGGVRFPPLVGYNPGTRFIIEGSASGAASALPKAEFQPITPGYFEAMGIPLLRGRGFTDAEMKAAPEAAIVNLSMAKKHWPDGNPVGQRIRLQGENVPDGSLTIVGVVGDVKQNGLHTTPRPEIFLPLRRPTMTLMVRSSVNPSSLFPSLRSKIEQLDATAAVSMKTMEQAVEDSLDKRRSMARLLGVLGATALLIAALGIYGVVSYLVSQRTREIGLRMALGAAAPDIRRMIQQQAMKLVLFGLGSGLVLSFALSRLMSNLLYGVTAIDPLTLGVVTVLLMMVAMAACYFPARRATRVDPITALRVD